MVRNRFIYVLLMLILLCCLPFSYASSYASRNESTSFISVTDLHFNPYAACSNAAPCPLFDKLQAADVSQWEAILAANDTTAINYGVDANYPLLKSTLAELKKRVAENNIQFVVMLGDYLGHGFREYYNNYATDKSPLAYQAFVKKTLQFVSQQVAATFPTTDVYAILGNNDSYIDDYVADTKGALYKDMAESFSMLVKDKNNRAALKVQFAKAGYYAVTIPSNNVRLIALNSNLFAEKETGEDVAQAASNELRWLRQELKAAHDHHQTVMITQHVPDVVDVYATLKANPLSVVTQFKSDYTNQYQAAIRAYSETIAIIMTAHFHSDWFQVITSRPATLGFHQPIAMTGVAAISPIFGNNPSYKVFEYNLKTRRVENFQTYINDLNKQNGWTMEYDFDAIYQPKCTDCNIINGMTALMPTGYLSQQYINEYNAGVYNQQVASKWLPYYWCQVFSVKAADYQACLSDMKKNQLN